MKSGAIGQAVSENKMLKDNSILYMYIAQGHGQITQRRSKVNLGSSYEQIW